MAPLFFLITMSVFDVIEINIIIIIIIIISRP